MLLVHPELAAAAVVALAWVALLAPQFRGSGGGSAGAHMARMNAMPGMVMSATGTRSTWSIGAAGLPGWMLMTVAMMGPAALSGIHHTGVNSLRWRRRRAMVEYAAAYLAVWTAFGFIVLTAVAKMPGVPGTTALALTLAAAAAWQLTPYKRRWLRDCHRSVPLPPHGWRAERGALRYGFRNGLSCLGSCWALMLIMVAAPSAQVLWAAALAGIVTTERLKQKPRRATRLTARALAFAAAVTAVIALA